MGCPGPGFTGEGKKESDEGTRRGKKGGRERWRKREGNV